MVAVRDKLTVRGLKRHRIDAYFLGNPMMDGLQRELPLKNLVSYRRLLLLAGSRLPEAKTNFKRVFFCYYC